MTAISEAVILMAGEGSRLRGADKTFLKPFVPVLGRPLISYTLDALIHARMINVNFVVGYESERVIAQIKPLVPPGLNPIFIENRDWKKQNGLSLLAVADHVDKPFLLAVSDHLFDEAVVARLMKSADFARLNLAIDKKLNSIFDLDDAMKVQTQGDRVAAIGKTLASYDAVDVGLFICSREIFKYLERAKLNGDCSLADGVRLMATDKKVHAIDIGEAWWQDVDTPDMLRRAEEKMRARPKS